MRMSWWLPGLYRDEAGYYRYDGTMDAETFSQARASLGRNEGPALLYDLYPQSIDVADHPEVVTEVWCMAEFPASLLDPDDWVSLFEEVGYTEDGKPAPRPRNPVTVYRGCSPERRFGMSWTTDIERARWFAQRDLGQGAGQLYEATIPPGCLLAYIHESHRLEAEFVVDPIALNDDTVRLVWGRES
ncbi:hypothetical protein [Mycobacterium sp. smrl_JER01]|uniref:hypothetical protein n=1 Tax=Mycobacterium sp. smrl_JER01 TaxID=3402633 RepID=UPI003D72FDB7